MKADLLKLSQFSTLALVTCCVSFVTGCRTEPDGSLTHKMWSDRNRRSIEEPSRQPRLALYEAPDGNDIIVEYDTMPGKREQSERRAYLLNENQKRVAAHRKPEFIDPSVADGQKVIPVVNSEIHNAPDLQAYAVVSNDGRRFVLYQNGESPKRFSLPVYQGAFGLVKQATLDPIRVALTPITAATDARKGTLVPTSDMEEALQTTGEVVSFAALLWIFAGAPGVNH